MYQEPSVGYNREFAEKAKREQAVRRAMALVEQERVTAKRVLRERGTPERFRDLIIKIADDHNIHAAEMIGDSRRDPVVEARHEAMYRIKEMWPALSYPRLGKWFARDHTSCIYAIAHYGKKHGLPPLTKSAGRR